jgi:hypothetical protein
MSDTDIRDGVLDYFLRAEQSGVLEQLFKEQIAPVVANAVTESRIGQLERDISAAVRERDELQKSLDTIHGAKFSARCYHALVSRATCAEKERDEAVAVLRDITDGVANDGGASIATVMRAREFLKKIGGAE